MFIPEISTWFLVFARVGALLALLPVLSAQEFPVRVRVLLAAVVAMLLSPFLPHPPAEGLGTWLMLRLAATEICIGLLLGFLCRLVFFALDMAGSLIATEMGLIMPSEINPFTSGQTAAPGMILYWMALMLWLSLDLHHWMIAAIQRSYTLAPVGAAHLSPVVFSEVLRRTAGIFDLAVQISAPVLAVSLVISLVFSMLGRAVPQMNVFAESFPARTLVGLVVFGSSCMVMAHHILNYLRRLPEDALRVMQLLHPV